MGVISQAWAEGFCSEQQADDNRAKLPFTSPVLVRAADNCEPDTHVGFSWRTFSDAGSTPAASTTVLTAQKRHPALGYVGQRGGSTL